MQILPIAIWILLAHTEHHFFGTKTKAAEPHCHLIGAIIQRVNNFVGYSFIFFHSFVVVFSTIRREEGFEFGSLA